MKQFFGMSQRGRLEEAVQGIRTPQFIMLLSNNEQFQEHVQALEKLFPGVPSIGCIGMSYQTSVVENGVGVIAFSDGVSASANVLEQVSTMPVKYIRRLEQDIQKVGGSNRDTVCIDFCTGNDACVLTTMYTALRQRGISLVGGTGGEGRVSANGVIYEDAVVYGLVRNLHGRVKTYKENIYHQMGDYRFIASGTDRAKYILGALNGQPAKQVYKNILHVTDEEILTRTFQNPFGKINGDDTCIISIKEVSGNALAGRLTTPTCSYFWSWAITRPLPGTPSSRSARTSPAARPSSPSTACSAISCFPSRTICRHICGKCRRWAATPDSWAMASTITTALSTSP